MDKNKNKKVKPCEEDINFYIENNDDNIEYILSKIIYHAIQVGKIQANFTTATQHLLSENCEIIDNLKVQLRDEIIDIIKFYKEV